MRLSTEPRDEAQALGVVHAALDAGLQLFDTATAYCAHDALGENERLLAKALATHPRGDRAIIVSKGGLRRPGGAWRPDGRARSILEDAERTAEALGRPPELYLLHAPDPSVPWATSVRALGEVASRGLARRIGLSNVTVAHLDEACALAPISAVQQGWSLFDDRARLSGVLAWCFERGLEVMAHSPLGGPKRIAKLAGSPVLSALAAAKGETAAVIALAALLDRHPLVSVIPGARRVETIADAARAERVSFTDDERARLREAFTALAAPIAATTSAGGGRGEVVLLMGLQGSGKSRLVDEYVANGFARFNRDLLGGTLKDVAHAMSRALAQGATHAVLDNTYTTRAARAAAIEAAKQRGAKVRGIWLDVPLHEAQVNVISRMLDAHGRLLGPDELKRQRDNTGLTPLSHFKTLRELEPPVREEGFDVLETRPFVRAPRSGGGGRFIAFEAVETVTRSDEPTFVFAWTERGSAVAEAAQRLGAQALVCAHGGGPPACWCRPPLPGLLLEACHRAGLDPSKCTVIGTTETHQVLAAAVGARFVSAG
ncbi:MAG: aldo/keto reductase [Myxococcaceae bacterium]|nr:aldo/keto reductase [Myxococcaceae bacterium]